MEKFNEIWPEELHSEFDQFKRRVNGEKISPKKITLDRDNQSAHMIGSHNEDYEVTLSSCTCVDFAFRRAPCKHIYRLATELGELPPFPERDPDRCAAVKDSIPSEIERWKGEFRAGGISADKLLKIVTALESD